jgi:hypothetical protein
MSACGLGTTPSTRTTLWHDLRLYAKLELFARQGVDELVPGADFLETNDHHSSYPDLVFFVLIYKLARGMLNCRKFVCIAS